MLKTYSLTILEKAINHAVALDPSTPNKLKTLDSKVLELIISPLQVNFFIYFVDTQIKLHASCIQGADATIKSSPLGLIRLSLLPASKLRSVFNDQVQITGDIEFGLKVKKIFDEIEIDWEGHLAQFTGDVIAYQLGSIVRQGMAFKDRLSKSVCRDLTNYLQEELCVCPPREELNDFFNDIDELSLCTARLEARIAKLKSLC